MIEELLKKWNIENIDRIEPTKEGGGRTWFVKANSERSFVLKESNLVKSKREYKYLQSLSKTKIPVALPVVTTEGEWYADNGQDKIYCLYPKLPGNVITEHYSGNAQKRANGFGQAIGLLHSQFRKIDSVHSDREMDFVGQIQRWAIPVIEKETTMVNPKTIVLVWEDIQPRLIALCKDIPLQLIHRDAHTSNMLFDAGKLTGFLDFELVTRGLPVFDVCYCGSCILVSGFEDPEKGKKWPAIFQSLLEGYQEHSTLTPLEHKSKYEVIVAIELIFMAFWLENGNVEFAEQTENLIRWLEKNKDTLKN